MSEWPFGKPQTTPGAYGVQDRQSREDAAFRLKWGAEGKLTPTKRLKRSADPVRYKQMVTEAMTLLEGIKADFPEYVEQYDRWIGECRVLLTYVK
jgi:hypothetical protein